MFVITLYIYVLSHIVFL